ncbi:MAG: inositol monophosphatase family protein [Cyanobacteria bacterium J06638_20]
MPLFSTAQVDEICRTLRTCGDQAVSMAQTKFQVYEKGKHDYVTDVDRALDKRLSGALTQLFPNDGVISEENPASRDRFSAPSAPTQRLWLIDPLDGTDDFIEGKLHYAIMLGALEDGVPQAGWVYSPAFRQLYWGGMGIGVFAAVDNDTPRLLPLPSYSAPSDRCTLLIGMKDNQRFGAAIAQAIPSAQFYSIGSFGLKVMEVVLGRADLYVYFNRKVKLWDTVGPLAIARAAGLECCEPDGTPIRFTRDDIDPTTLTHHQPILVAYPEKMARWRSVVQQAVMPLLT